MPPKESPAFWDTSVFLSLFQKGDMDDRKFQREQAILLLKDVIKNRLTILTSTLSIAEARRGDGYPPLPGQEHVTLEAFFKHEYIRVVSVNRGIAEMAAAYGETYHLKPPDAIQLATAVRSKARVFLAWDRGFFRTGAIPNPPIPIEQPHWAGQLPLGVEVRSDDAKL